MRVVHLCAFVCYFHRTAHSFFTLGKSSSQLARCDPSPWGPETFPSRSRASEATSAWCMCRASSTVWRRCASTAPACSARTARYDLKHSHWESHSSQMRHTARILCKACWVHAYIMPVLVFRRLRGNRGKGKWQWWGEVWGMWDKGEWQERKGFFFFLFQRCKSVAKFQCKAYTYSNFSVTRNKKAIFFRCGWLPTPARVFVPTCQSDDAQTTMAEMTDG